MEFFISDDEIENLILEEKRISVSLSKIGSTFKEKRGHREYDLLIPRANDGEFCLKIRQSLINPLAFSVILAYVPQGRTDWFILRRYNGKNHRHGNKLERQAAFYDFHIHTATERYQMEGMYPEAYAEITDRYSDLDGAIRCFIDDCGIVSEDKQHNLF